MPSHYLPLRARMSCVHRVDETRREPHMNGAVAADWGGESVSPVTIAESVEVLGQGGDRMGLPVNI